MRLKNRSLIATMLVGVALPIAPVAAQGVKDAEESTMAPDWSTQELVVFGRVQTDTILSIPQTVSVLDENLIEQTGSQTVGDVLRFVPGAQRDGSPLDAFGDTYLIRGFEANQTLNGLYANRLQQARDSVGIERIEVLKGPASVIYGQLQPGAVVNVVTKQPARTFAGSASASYGRFDEFRGTLDLTGPLTQGGDLRFRVTAAYDDAGSFVDFWHRKHVFVAPVLAADLGDATTVTLEGFYSRNRLDGFYNGVPAAGTVLPNPYGELSRSLSLTDPTLDPSIRENANAQLRLEHRFSNNLRWRAAVDWTHESRDETNVLGTFGYDVENLSLSRLVLDGGGKGNNWTIHNDIAADFSTGSIGHALVVGGDYTTLRRTTPRRVFILPSLDLFDPTYSIDAPPPMAEVPSYAQSVLDRSHALGLFVQDRIALTDQLKAIIGVRWSDFSQTTRTTRANNSVVESRQDDTAWTTQFGLLYTPSDSLSLFASRTTSFLPTYGMSADGTALPPETGTQYEAGVKVQLMDARVSLGASVFHLERGNVGVADRDNPGFEISIGEQRAQGFELTAELRPLDGLNVYAGYAYTDAKTTRDTDDTLQGKRIRNVPKHSFVMRGAYELQGGPLQGLSLGGSATHTSERAGTLENLFMLPSYWRADADISYPLTPNIEIGGTIKNLTNERYFDYAYSEFEVWPGAPRTWSLFLRSRF